MTDAYIYDAVRSPRGKGRADGSLNEVTALRLSAQVLDALKDRNGLDTAGIEDVGDMVLVVAAWVPRLPNLRISAKRPDRKTSTAKFWRRFRECVRTSVSLR